MSAEVYDVLVEARSLIADPTRWTQGALARQVENGPTSPSADDAIAWCAAGALEHVGGCTAAHRASLFLASLIGQSLVGFNDDPLTEHSEVLWLFDRAIEATKP